MNHLSSLIEHYLEYCKYQKCLDKKTLKSYRIDLRQFSEHVPMTEVSAVTSSIIESYIASLHAQYQPKTVKRKIASLKAFFHFLEYREIIDQNPFNKIQIHFREPIKLPNAECSDNISAEKCLA